MPSPFPTVQPPTLNITETISAILLASTGGTLDAIVYLNHGHVFANAVTGNVIFLGISLIARDWPQVLRHVMPIVAFMLGVVAARLLRRIPSRNSALLVLSLQIAALFSIGLVTRSVPQITFVAIISFVSAFQVTTFRRVGRFTYNSTFVTGNLREVADGLVDRFLAIDPAERWLGRAKALKLGAICTGFLLGAALGAFVAPRFPTYAILFAEPTLLITLWMTLERKASRTAP